LRSKTYFRRQPSLNQNSIIIHSTVSNSMNQPLSSIRMRMIPWAEKFVSNNPFDKTPGL
jgi:hypothetical protein